MFQRQVMHVAGTFARCADCGREPRHYTARGSLLSEGVRFHAIPPRHQLSCPCGRSTGWMPTLTDAMRAWGELGETLPLPLQEALRAANVRPLRQAKGRAQG